MKKEKIKFEKVPMPKKGAGRPRKYNFEGMKVGESFFAKTKQSTLLSSAACFCNTNGKTWKFSAREEKGGARIWRIS